MDEITFDNAPTGYPISRERIKFETELTKNAKSPKKALELPASDFSQKAILDYANHHKMAAIKGHESWFLFDRRQVSEPEVRKQIASGEYGHLLGYSDNSTPEQGQQVAISVEGQFSADPSEILEWRDNNKLGLTWRAQSIEDAAATAAQHTGAYG